MKLLGGNLRLSATDVSNHLACRHLTQLDLQAARGERSAPDWAAPDLKVIQELGKRHEAAYLKYLEEEKKLRVVRLVEHGADTELIEETLLLMAEGVDVIAQGALQEGHWFGRPDVLLKVGTPSGKWKWSYEVQDTKLAKETKATTILQLSVYSELLELAQGKAPECMWVITPAAGYAGERYRVAEYAAYFRYVKREMMRATESGNATYPEPVEHCNVCRWFKECGELRRKDDHLSLVAGIRTQQREQLKEWKVGTVAELAKVPVPIKEKPKYGSRDGYERVREQARVQVAGREENKPVHEAILPVAEGMGFCRLPEPNRLDVFVDLEGDPFAGTQGQQYLFGLSAREANGELFYEKRWALTAEEEKSGFEWLMDEIVRRWSEEPGMHVYHYGANEPSAFKRLMGQYATREEEMDRMLRGGKFVDLHRVVKQGVRASVEEYSLKKMEAFCGFERKTSLDLSRAAMRYIEHHLELGWRDETLRDDMREAMEGYNREDCESTAALRDWLEAERAKLIATGEKIRRPEMKDPEPAVELSERQKRVAELVERLTKDLPVHRAERSDAQQAQWLLAQLLDWHRREDKATWWEGFRLAELDEDELLEERSGLGGLQHVKTLQTERKSIPVERYRFEKQETEVREEKELYCKGEKFGAVVAVDFAARTVDVKKTKKSAGWHAEGVYVWDPPLNVTQQADALLRVGESVEANGIEKEGEFQAARDLMLRRAPRLSNAETIGVLPGELTEETACRIGRAMNATTFAIQGPPGAGKTFTGARMICDLVKRGKRIGVAALSHKVVRKLLQEVVKAASEKAVHEMRCIQRWNEGEPEQGIAVAKKNEEIFAALRARSASVIGGTSFLWSRTEMADALDVLFIDEAGQMALADVISVAHAAKNLVLIGDPQQLERPLKGSHPEGAEKSALEHLLDEHKTILPEMGLLLPETWRLHPNICRFTSELFYEGRLKSRDVLSGHVIEGHPWVQGAGLWFVPVEHEGNRNSSAQEVEAITKIVKSLVASNVRFFRGTESRNLTTDDILVVAPYNAQVSDLLGRLPGTRVGTVDKFQGQEAPVVIYSLTTSSPEDAPRGMEFLYSLNRLNVATSRAMSAVIVVGSAKLFEPECRTPRQMQLANALCAYREMATTIDSKPL